MSATARTFTVRHVQLLRAFFAALSAVMVTFSADHSAEVGFSVFGGFVAASGLVLLIAAWVVPRPDGRAPYILLGIVDLLAAAVSGVPALRTEGAFFLVLIIWAAATGLIELIAGLRARNIDSTAKDSITIGVLGLLLAVILLVIPVGYSLDYTVEGAGALTLTGIILAVGMLGGYTAIVAVFLAIAGFSPRRAEEKKDAATGAATSEPVETGGQS
ncbi:acyl-CoA synthetase [uncultured Microbacterium sp.]|uniref:acyl-CoA synthetase n=1 Tax=uncultured Microbacterium sp. TaxID=191216 RepID=UPI00262AC326|nr:acyl-CoA synthetase [uncultured Microbacterium sp.]